MFAIAHVRGGGEMGRAWYEAGKFLAKANTFTDFIAAAGARAPGLTGGAGRGGGAPGGAAPLAPLPLASLAHGAPSLSPRPTADRTKQST